jgi:hypothetical protein
MIDQIVNNVTFIRHLIKYDEFTQWNLAIRYLKRAIINAIKNAKLLNSIYRLICKE